MNLRAIRNAVVITPSGRTNGGVIIEDGKIAAVAADGYLPSGGEVIDAKGCVLLPGVVDPEGHLGANGPIEEDLLTESRAALATGVTTWNLQQTSHTIYGIGEERPSPETKLLFSSLVDRFMAIGAKSSYCDFRLTPNITSIEQAAEIPMLGKRGLRTYKMFLHMRLSQQELISAWAQAPKLGVQGFDDAVVFEVMRHVAALDGGLLSLHCENWQIARLLERELRQKGRTDTAAWHDRSPDFVEAIDVWTFSYLARKLGCPLYVQHVTTPETVAAIQAARSHGSRIYGQTAAHYLVLDADAWKINTPLRPTSMHAALWEALASGALDCVGSDHVNRRMSKEQMDKGNVWEDISGFPSRIEAHLPILLSEGVHEGRLTLERLAQVVSETPARLWGMYPRKGAIQVGADADFVLVDPSKKVRLSRDHILSATGWSAYEGRVFHGWPVMTVLRGDVVAEWEGEKVALRESPSGRYVEHSAAAAVN